MARNPRRAEASNVAYAGAAGGSLGTILAACATTIHDEPWKQIVSMTIPTVSVSISGVWFFVKSVYLDPYVKAKKHKVADAAIEKLLADAKQIREQVNANESATQAHKNAASKTVEDLEKMKLQLIADRMDGISVD